MCLGPFFLVNGTTVFALSCAFLRTLSTFLELACKLAASNQEQIRASKYNQEVEDAVGPEDAVVSPVVIVVYAEASCEFIPRSVLAECTLPVDLANVATSFCDVGSGIALAGLARRSIEVGVFVR